MFPEVIVEASHPNHATLQSFTIAIYVCVSLSSFFASRFERIQKEVGCLFGALSNLWVGDKLGRRRTLIFGGSIMLIGAILQATPYSFAQLIFARIFTGLGNGLIVRHSIRSDTLRCLTVGNRLLPFQLIMRKCHQRQSEEG